MRKALLLLSLLLLPTLSHAENLTVTTYTLTATSGSIVLSVQRITPSLTCYSYAWTSNSAGFAGPANFPMNGYISRLVAIPSPSGATNPTDSYDITLTDIDSVDLTAGKGTNLNKYATSNIIPLFGNGTTTNTLIPVNGRTTFLAQNAGNAKTGTYRVYLLTPTSLPNR